MSWSTTKSGGGGGSGGDGGGRDGSGHDCGFRGQAAERDHARRAGGGEKKTVQGELVYTGPRVVYESIIIIIFPAQTMIAGETR